MRSFGAWATMMLHDLRDVGHGDWQTLTNFLVNPLDNADTVF